MSTTADTPRPGTTHPHLARERALKVLFAADVRGVDPRVLLDSVDTSRHALELLDELEPDEDQVAGDAELQLELRRRRRLPLDDYTRTLVRGVASRRQAIDELLGEVADRWAVSRMPSVDRNLLRLAIYELAEQDTPHAVVINEAVALAGGFAGEKARGFVNGVLETIRKRVVAGEIALAVEAPPAAAEPTPVDDAFASRVGIGDGAADEDGGQTDASAPSPEPEVDEAAEAAYDLALDLLDDEDGELDLEAYDADDFDTDDDLDEDDRFEDLDALDTALFGRDEEDGFDDEGDTLW